ncbi:DUF3168 domain-containing protein [Pararhodobacter sp.]|uniref:DUF3168 domain-containing protein n=1 Tax=Pararhodobacter sp. TaxID=2127056 RepID=UPI002B002350|nr:DUF3168 domain-containing protein [Pararhodobacter sp.]
MTDPLYELKAAIITTLRGDARVSGFVARRVYDRVPTGDQAPPSPYVSMGPFDGTEDSADCIDGLAVSLQIDVWSWGDGEAYSSAECSKIAQAVRRALHDRELALPAAALVNLRHRMTRIMQASDGITNHGALTFEATLEG